MNGKQEIDIVRMMDEYQMRKDAEREHRASYLQGLEDLSVAVTPTGVDIAFLQQFFADRVADFDADVVQTYDYPIWKTVGYLLSFDMEFFYAFLLTEPGHLPDIKRDIVGTSEIMEGERQDQKTVGAALKAYLTAAGALARRIGSTTYPAWRELLVEVEFAKCRGTRMFADVETFDDFLFRMNVELRRLWADVRILSHRTTVAPKGRGN